MRLRWRVDYLHVRKCNNCFWFTLYGWFSFLNEAKITIAVASDFNIEALHVSIAVQQYYK